MPSDLQDTALVTVAGGLGAPVSSLWPSWVMYLRETKGNTNIEVNHSEKGKPTVCAGEFPESSKEQNSLTENEGGLSDL